MAKTISQLKVKLETELEQCQHRLRRLEQRKSYYEKGNRQKCAHRFIIRRAAVESLSPSVKGMAERSEGQFAVYRAGGAAVQ